jgi:hypothetical protein
VSANGTAIEPSIGHGLGGQHPIHFGHKQRVAATCLFDVRLSLRSRALECRLENSPDLAEIRSQSTERRWISGGLGSR